MRTWEGGAGGAVHYYALDLPSNDVRGLFNASGAVTHRYQYSPFGEQQAASESTHNPLRFAARELDAQTGLYYVRARWYDPFLGRFLSEDPIGLAGGMNEYTYAVNDPVNLSDPSGLRHDGGSYCTGFGYTQSPSQIGSRFWEFEHEGRGWHAHESNGWIELCPNYTGRGHDDGTGPSMRGHRPIDWGPILDPIHADIAAAEEQDRRCTDARDVALASYAGAVLNIGEGDWRWVIIFIVLSVALSYVSIRDYRYEVSVRQNDGGESGG
jgi:RHS repeat-associated protein